MALPEGWAVEEEAPTLPEGWAVEDDADPDWQGPPLDAAGPDPDVYEERRDSVSMPRAFAEGVADAVPFGRDVDAALVGAVPQVVSEGTTAMAGGSPSLGRVLEAYRERKQAGMQQAANAREDEPLAYYAGNIPAGVAGAVATGGGSLARRGVSDLVGLVGQAENYGEAGPGDVAAPLIAGKALGQAGRVGSGLVQAVASTLKVSKEVADRLLAKFGATRIAKMIAGGEKSPDGAVWSDFVRSLKGNIDAEARFKPKSVETWTETPNDFARKAAQAAVDAENGAAQLGPGPGDFVGNPDLYPSADDAAYDALRRNRSDIAPGNVDDMIDTARAWIPDPAAETARKSTMGANMQADREAFVAKAREYQALLQQAAAAESQNRMEAARLRGLAERAKGQLEALSIGRRATEKVAGAVAGWGMGAAGGTIGKVAGASAGFKLGAPVGQGIDLAAAGGQKIAAWAASNAKAWAERGDELGRMAQWALSASGEPQAAVRMAVLGQEAAQMDLNEGSESVSP